MEKPKNDELTEKMHDEFEIDEETEKKHLVWGFLRYRNVFPGNRTRKDMMESRGITEEDVKKYQPEWEKLNQQSKSLRKK